MRVAKEDATAYLLYTLIMTVAIVSGMSGCATFNRMVTNDALVSQLAVEAATARVLHEHPNWKATTVKITEGAMAVIDKKVVTDLASLESYVKDQINWSRLVPEEQALVSTLISQVRQNIEDSYRAREGSADGSVIADGEQTRLIAVHQVLEWINETAKRQ